MERTNNKLDPIWRRRRDLNPGHIAWWEASALTTEPPFLPYILIIVNMIAPLFKTLIGGPALVCELTHISI